MSHVTFLFATTRDESHKLFVETMMKTTLRVGLFASRRLAKLQPAIVCLRRNNDEFQQCFVNGLYRFSRRQFSTEETETTSSSTYFSAPLRSMIKPFLLKCHPDVQPVDKEVNLLAIQNLNMYLDTVHSALSGTAKRKPSSEIVEIDFVMFSVTSSSQQQSRRKVQLVLPPWPLCQQASMQNPKILQQIQLHASRELIKLLKVAGLPIPRNEQQEAMERVFEIGLGLTDYDRSRDYFTQRIDWNRLNAQYDKAVADMHADIATAGLVQENKSRRRRQIAILLGNVRLAQADIPVTEQMIAYRRLSLLLDQNFEHLRMEDFGSYWETCKIVLGPMRPYYTSRSALYKRRRRGLETGYSFTLHPDYSVTMQVPIDFRDDELINELDQNLWDFYDIVGDGTDDIFPDMSLFAENNGGPTTKEVNEAAAATATA
jgi:hypothetical protein